MRSSSLAYMACLVLAMLVIYAVVYDDASAWTILSLLGTEPLYFLASTTLYYIHDPWLGIVAVSSIIISGQLVILLKESLDVPRPPKGLWRAEASGPSFPSGHATVASAFWSSIALAKPLTVTTLLAVIIVLGVSLSRIGLRVHYPIDVIAGIALGTLIGLISSTYYTRAKKLLRLTALHSVVALLLALLIGIKRYEFYALTGLGLGLWLGARNKNITIKEPLVRRIYTLIGVIIVGIAIMTATKALVSVQPLIALPAYLVLGVIIVRTPIR